MILQDVPEETKERVRERDEPSTEEKELEEKHLLTLAVMTTLVIERAIVKSVKQAKTVEDIPSVDDWLSPRT